MKIKKFFQIEYLALYFVLYGVWEIGSKNITGQYSMAVAQVLWGIIAFQKKMRGLLIQSILLFALAIRSIYLWL